MTPLDHPALQNLHQRTTAMLTAIDDTPLEDIDHVHYQHYYEELRLLVQEWLTATNSAPQALPDQSWVITRHGVCLLYTSPSPRDRTRSRMPSSA